MDVTPTLERLIHFDSFEEQRLTNVESEIQSRFHSKSSRMVVMQGLSFSHARIETHSFYVKKQHFFLFTSTDMMIPWKYTTGDRLLSNMTMCKSNPHLLI